MATRETSSWAMSRRPKRQRTSAAARTTALMLLLSLGTTATTNTNSVEAFAPLSVSPKRRHHLFERSSEPPLQQSSAATTGVVPATGKPTPSSSAPSSTTTAQYGWSLLAGDRESSGSKRRGVRQRIRSTLKRAKRRTGVSNISEDDDDSLLVSRAASIGAFDQGSDLVYNNGKSEKSASFSSALRNNTDTGLVVESPKKNGASKSKMSSVWLPSGDTGLADTEVSSLPFSLPKLSEEQLQLLAQGERIQEQSKMGREGQGYVVVDVPAPAEAVWECLLDFEAYPQNIGTVRWMQLFTSENLDSSVYGETPVQSDTRKGTRHFGQACITRAKFVLSKFYIEIAAVHQYQPHPKGHYMEFTLDRANKNVVLRDAKGIWYTEKIDENTTRVFLLCQVQVTRALPSFIVDYTAARAMPRATQWLKPTVESYWKQRQRDANASAPPPPPR